MMVEISGPPAINFYSMLSGLGDQIAANRQQANRQAALTAVTQPGVSYGDAMRGLIASGDLQGAQMFANLQAHKDALDRQASEDVHRAQREGVEDKFRNAQLEISRQDANRRDRSAADLAAEREEVARKYGIDPTSAEGRTFIATGTYPEPKKPIPFETLGGTKFMAPQPGGGYTIVDPTALSPSQQPQQPLQSAQPSAPPVVTSQPQNVPSVTPTVSSQPQASAAPADLSAIDPNTGRREAWLKTQPQDVQAYIKKIADYEVDPRTTSIKGGHREQVMSAVAQYDPTYDQNTFGSRAKAIKDFSTGQQGNAIRSFDVATDHLDTLQKYANALKSGDYRLINSIRNAWMAETGSSLPTNVQAVAPIVGAEVSKAIIGSNNALADREELRKPLNTANSPEQLAGAIEGYKSLMAGQLKGLKKQYEDTTGKKDFNNRVRQSTLNVLTRGDVPTSDAPQNTTSTGVKWSVQ